MAHDFRREGDAPVAWEYDKEGTWPEDVMRTAWELGLMNSHIEEEYGGPGASFLDGTLIEEELAGAVAASAPRSPATAWRPRRSRSAAPTR